MDTAEISTDERLEIVQVGITTSEAPEVQCIVRLYCKETGKFVKFVLLGMQEVGPESNGQCSVTLGGEPLTAARNYEGLRGKISDRYQNDPHNVPSLTHIQ